ncbi:hypothetical protein Vi05172_g362 [Venturia inaequalis]|nr:hypothetical protein Vi05172_g362 [Venturia inaequalis]
MSSVMYSIALLFLFLRATSAQSCFWPNGTKTDVFKPCANSGACCYYIDEAHHDPCYSNGFCQSLFHGFLYRGACRSANWDTGLGCASDCLQVSPGDQARVQMCDGFSCCNSPDVNSSCCGNSRDTVLWYNATLLPLTKTGTATSLPTTATAASTNPLSTSPLSTSPLSTSPLPTTSSAVSCPDTSSLPLGAGLGIPFALSLVAIGILSWMLVRKRGARNASQVAFTVTNEEKPLRVDKQTHELGLPEIVELGTESEIRGYRNGR